MEVEFQGTRRFEIRRRLGEGGMGVVYEAFDRDKGVGLALKTLRRPSPDAILRLKNEFRALQDIRQQNLIRLDELFEDEGVWFFTMELVHGSTLLEYLRPGTSLLWSSSALASTEDMHRPTAGSGAAAPAPSHRDPRAPVASGFDEARVRDVLAQLTRGLSALHQAGKVHRDIKPSNIMVDACGRVVLLDFGLVADTERGPALTEGGMVGTVAYMAPEQALGEPVGPEADWYSVGVVLYEALTGVLPFQGSQMHILMQKQRPVLPPRPITRVAHVPADLDSVCIELLEVDPHRRPTGPALMRRLGGADPAGVTTQVTRSATTVPQAFVGRDAELAMLNAALDDVRAGHLVCTYVHGESGIGKSSLVRAFCQRAAQDNRVVVLAGRCYERENVPYRVLDGVIDSLTRYLRRLPMEEAAALIPQRVAPLLQVFPALKRVDVFADAPRHELVDPQQLRTRAFGALRELFDRLTERRTVIVAIDDLQWADVDGLEMLSELLRPPHAPPFLLVGSWRQADEDRVDVVRSLEALPGEARHLRLGRLPDAAAHELAERLLAQAGLSGERLAATARSIAREAVGHPLFLDELARYSATASEPVVAQGPVKLADVVWARISRLSPVSRRVLEVVAVAGAPIDQDIAASAAGLDVDTFASHAALLRVSNLVRTTGGGSTDTIEPYHDRVRQAVLDNLDAEVTIRCHRELARSLDTSGRADPEDLIEHYRGAHELDRAGHCAAQAAAGAAQALAFDQAARLYELAIELQPELDRSPALRDAYARVAVYSGRFEAGARQLEALVAASGLKGSMRWDTTLRLAELRYRQHQHHSSIEPLERVLRDMGERVPRGRLARNLLVMPHVARIVARGLLPGGIRMVPASDPALADVRARAWYLLAESYMFVDAKDVLFAGAVNGGQCVSQGLHGFSAPVFAGLAFLFGAEGMGVISRRYEAAARDLVEGEPTRVGAPDVSGRALVQMLLIGAQQFRGELAAHHWERMRSSVAQALHAVQASGDPQRFWLVLAFVANVYWHRGHLSSYVECIRWAIRLARERRLDAIEYLQSNDVAGRTAELEGDFEAAETAWVRYCDRSREVGDEYDQRAGEVRRLWACALRLAPGHAGGNADLVAQAVSTVERCLERRFFYFEGAILPRALAAILLLEPGAPSTRLSKLVRTCRAMCMNNAVPRPLYVALGGAFHARAGATQRACRRFEAAVELGIVSGMIDVVLDVYRLAARVLPASGPERAVYEQLDGLLAARIVSAPGMSPAQLAEGESAPPVIVPRVSELAARQLPGR